MIELPDLPQPQQHADLREWAERLIVALRQMQETIGEGSVAKGGDTMSGNLRLEKAVPIIFLYDTTAPANKRLFGVYSEAGRVGIAAYNDAGAWQRTVAYGTHEGVWVSPSQFLVSSAYPFYSFDDIDGALNERFSHFALNNGTLGYHRYNDDGTYRDTPFFVAGDKMTANGQFNSWKGAPVSWSDAAVADVVFTGLANARLVRVYGYIIPSVMLDQPFVQVGNSGGWFAGATDYTYTWTQNSSGATTIGGGALSYFPFIGTTENYIQATFELVISRSGLIFTTGYSNHERWSAARLSGRNSFHIGTNNWDRLRFGCAGGNTLRHRISVEYQE